MHNPAHLQTFTCKDIRAHSNIKPIQQPALHTLPDLCAPLVLFIEARPLKSWPVCPLLPWCRLSTSWVHAVPSFLYFSPSVSILLHSHSSGYPHSSSLFPHRDILLSLLCVVNTPCTLNPHFRLSPRLFKIKLCMSDKNNTINQPLCSSFYLYFFYFIPPVPLACRIAVCLILSSLSCVALLYLASYCGNKMGI